MEKIQDLLEGQIDFEGQRLAEFINTMLLVFVGGIAWFVGFATEDITKTVKIGLGGGLLTLLLVVPPWPIYNWYPVKFLKTATEVDSSDIVVVGSEDKKSQ